MKTKRLNIAIRIVCMCAMILSCSSCGFICGPHYSHPDLVGRDPRGGYICFYQFIDTSYLNKIIVKYIGNWEVPDDYDKAKYEKRLGSKYVIPLYPKNHVGQPIFGERGDGSLYDYGYAYGDFYKLEDLIDSPKFIALKGGYYICYPFTCLERIGLFLDAEWKDLATTDFDKVEVLPSPHKLRYSISERNLAHLTKKSTKHFPKENAEMMTIDDVVNTLNILIETNRIEEYCYRMYEQPIAP